MNGNRKSFKLTKDGTVQYTLTYDYDKMNRLTKVYENGTSKAEYTYNADGTLKKASYGNQTTNYGYNLANLLTEVNSANGSTQISKYSYTYYLDGNQKSKTASVAGTSTGTTNYIYDGVNRLVQEQAPDKTYSYQYDSYGNRSQLSVTGRESYTTSYTYDKNNRLRNQTKTADTSSEITDFRYDPNGNQISSMTIIIKDTGGPGVPAMSFDLAGDNTNSYNEYNSWNQLTKTMHNDKITSYTYNGDGLRMSKTVDGVTTSHIWDGTNIAGDVTNGTVTKYIRGLQLISSKKGSNESFYTYNGHGDVVQLTNSSGDITKQYSYDAFGVEINKDDTDANPFRYCGEYYDSEADSMYLRARYYTPSIGRFISEDPANARLNWYVYCSSNPINAWDPLGLDEFLPILEEQHDNTTVYLRDMFNMYAGKYDSITMVDGGVRVTLNGISQVYYYNTTQHASVDGNRMDGDRMLIDAVSFANRFNLVRTAKTSGSKPYIFFTPGGNSLYNSAGASWTFQVSYVNSPIGKIITHQSFSVDINSWATYLDEQPNISVSNRVTYSNYDNFVQYSYLFDHTQDYITRPKTDASVQYIYTSGQHIVLHKNTNKAKINFSLVAGISTRYESVELYLF